MTIKFVYDQADPISLISIENAGESIEFPKNITKIESNETFSPFSSCLKKVVNISFEQDSQLTHLGTYCFARTTKLINADLSNCLQLESLNFRLFYRSSITSIKLPENGCLTMIHAGAFASSKLTSIKIPDTVQTIEEFVSNMSGVFSYCSDLTKIEISANSSMRTIGYAIAQGSSVESFFIPKGVTSFNSGALNSMPKLKNITVDPGNNELCSIDNVIYTKNKDALVFCACDKQSIKTESTVVAIHLEAFRGCKIQGTYKVPYGVTSLGQNVFAGTLFSEVILPETMKYLYSYCFNRACIKTIVIPSSVLQIFERAFVGTMLKTIVFSSPNTSLEIRDNAFLMCTQLKSIVLPIKNVAMNFEKAFTNCTNLSKVYYPLTNYPTNRRDTGTKKIRFYARIESKPEPKSESESGQEQGQGQKVNHCGDVEVNSNKNACRINRNTMKQSINYFSNIFRYSLSIIIMY